MLKCSICGFESSIAEEFSGKDICNECFYTNTLEEVKPDEERPVHAGVTVCKSAR